MGETGNFRNLRMLVAILKDRIASRGATMSEKLEYLQEIIGELADLAESDQQPMLAYLLRMAEIEADDLLRAASEPEVTRESQEAGTSPVPPFPAP